jgi:hypothetical protein
MEGSGRGLIEIVCGICLEVLKKPTKDLSLDSRPPDRDSTRAPPEYESRVSPLDHSVRFDQLRCKLFKMVKIHIVVVWYTAAYSLVLHNVKIRNMNSVFCLPLVL